MNSYIDQIHFSGVAHRTAHFLQQAHLYNTELWKKFVDVYRSQPDGENRGWRGEYWGKMMRGAVLVYRYTQDPALYRTLTDSVRDMLTVAEEDGRVSSYTRESELDGWDLWGRKYVILACEYYLEICEDEALRAQIMAFISRCADDILEHVGPQKKEITQTSHFWFGLNSSSILEPMVRLYRLTGEQRYLDFSSYIVKAGGAQGINVFELAYENRLYPYQYGISKAYELTSCFEGLLEYYEATGIEKYRTAVLHYAKALLDSELSIIGCSGMTHELMDHTRTRQTVRCSENEVMQETCVTVTLMKFFARLLTLTRDSAFADAIETSFYNAYLGALNTEHCESAYRPGSHPNSPVVSTDLPFDSYSPLTPGKRGKMIGGYQVLPDRSYYGCCACIGAAGVGVFLQHAVVPEPDGVTVNFYERGSVRFTWRGVPVTLELDTDYPADGTVTISVTAEQPVEFALRLRNPGWASAPVGYATYKRVWHENRIELRWDMPIRIHRPEAWEEDVIYTDMSKPVNSYYAAAPVKVRHQKEEEDFFAVTRGPLTLAADSRTGKAADSVFSIPQGGVICENTVVDGVPCLVKMRFQGADGEPYYLVDYAHAGRDWNTLIAAWLPTR